MSKCASQSVLLFAFQEQLRDVMFFVQAQETIANSPLRDEIQEGNVRVAANSTTDGAAATPKAHAGSKKRKGK